MRRVPPYPLWLGHVGDVRDILGLSTAGIVAVVDLASNEPPASVPREMVYCRFPLLDGGGNPPWLLRAAVETVASLLRAGVPTLVFCSAGMSRSPAVAAGAISAVSGRPPDLCLTEIAQSGPADVLPALWREIASVLT